jgi:ABC-2 type transport system ATP-binding protein
MIEITDLTKYYGDLCALDHVSLTIERGKVLGLLGPNGAGKTTAMRILTGYLSATSGKVVARGLDVEKNSIEVKRMIGYLPESAPLYQDMLVYDYLLYVAEIRGLGTAAMGDRIKELVDICGLRDVMHRSIHELSKGYKQRVGLAHAMMGDPEILILDEPTSGLDPNQIVEIRDIIRKIGSEKTVILSTHILSEVEATCDRVVIINKGKIVADGSTEELKKSSEAEYSLSMVLRGADEDKVSSLLSGIDGVTGIEKTGAENGDMSFNVSCSTSEDIRAEVYEKIKGTGWILLDYRQESKSFEKIFRELTKEN